MASIFFESIRLVDVERVESAVIAWAFSSNSDAMTLQDKLTALKNMFDVKVDISNVDEIEALTEWNHIDIVFKLKEKGVVKHLLVIENKIRCDLHDNQLSHREADIKSLGIPYSLTYLTLLPRPNFGTWKNISCSILGLELSKALIYSNGVCGTNADYQIADSYSCSVLKMTREAARALSAPSIVFSSNPSPDIPPSLCPVLQEYYFISIKQTMEKRLLDYLAQKGLVPKFHVSVNHIIESDEPEIVVHLADTKGDFSIAFQSGTFKIAAGIDLLWDKKAKSMFSLNGEWYNQTNPADVLFDGFKECLDELMRRFFI